VNVADIDMKSSVIKLATDTSADESLSRLGQQLCGGSETAVRHLLVFGRYLHQLSLRLVSEHTSHNDLHRRMLRVSHRWFFCISVLLLLCCYCIISLKTHLHLNHPCLGE